MGSKNRIAEKIVSQLPQATHFYDLFGGGGAISHCAMLSGKYQFVHYNELDPLVFKGFKMFINGDFKSEDRWISREEFFKLKDSDPYVAICFSFGSGMRSYRFNPEKELFQKAVHYSICFDDNSLLSEYIDLSGFEYTKADPRERRLELQKYFTGLYKQGKLDKRIETYAEYNGHSIGEISSNNQSLERLNSFNLDNKRIILTKTEQYNSGFNHNDFYEWLRHSENRVYISEYQMPDDFFLVYSVRKNCKLNNNSSKVSVENLYSNKPLENPLEF